MGKISGQNFVIRFFCKYLAIGRKISKMAITFEGSTISPNSLRVFLRIIIPTYGQNIIENGVDQFGTFPRKMPVALRKCKVFRADFFAINSNSYVEFML